MYQISSKKKIPRVTSGISTASTAANLIPLVAETLAGIIPLRVVLIRIGRGTLVPHVRVETCPPVGGVGDDLGPTVRQLHSVLAANCLAIARLASAKIVSGSVVLHGIAEFIALGLKQMNGDQRVSFLLPSLAYGETMRKWESGKKVYMEHSHLDKGR